MPKIDHSGLAKRKELCLVHFDSEVPSVAGGKRVTRPPEAPLRVAGDAPDLAGKPRRAVRPKTRPPEPTTPEAPIEVVKAPRAKRPRRTQPTAVIQPATVAATSRTRRAPTTSGDFEQEVESLIGVSFHKRAMLRQAFVHRSYMNEFPSPGLESNERLEFFGDAVLSYVVAERLFRDNPDIQEGELTEWRGYLVKRDSLAAFARKLGLGPYLLLGHGEEAAGGRDRNANLACLFEAVVGAIAIDRG